MLLAGLAVLFVWLAWGQVNRFLRPRLAEFSLPKKLFWAVTAGAVGVLLVRTIPVPPAPIWTAHRVKIVATGKKSATSQGSEVWVSGLFTPDGRCIVPATEFSKEGDWEVGEEAFVSRHRQPATLTWEGLGLQELQLRLLSQPASGIAKVAWNGGEQEVDLYATRAAAKTIPPFGAPPERTLAKRFLLRAAEAITLGACLFWLALHVSPARAPMPSKPTASQHSSPRRRRTTCSAPRDTRLLRSPARDPRPLRATSGRPTAP